MDAIGVSWPTCETSGAVVSAEESDSSSEDVEEESESEEEEEDPVLPAVEGGRVKKKV